MVVIVLRLCSHPSLSFTPGLKPTCFKNPTPAFSLLPLGLPSDYCPNRFFWATRFLLFILIFSFLCLPLDEAGHPVSFWAHVNLSYHIVSNHSASIQCFDAVGWVTEKDTIKPLMFSCPLFHKFCELNKTAKVKGANMCLTLTDDFKLLVRWNYVIWIRQNKRHQNNFPHEVANF